MLSGNPLAARHGRFSHLRDVQLKVEARHHYIASLRTTRGARLRRYHVGKTCAPPAVTGTAGPTQLSVPVTLISYCGREAAAGGATGSGAGNTLGCGGGGGVTPLGGGVTGFGVAMTGSYRGKRKSC